MGEYDELLFDKSLEEARHIQCQDCRYDSSNLQLLCCHFNTFLKWLAGHHITPLRRIKHLLEPKRAIVVKMGTAMVPHKLKQMLWTLFIVVECEVRL